jgi:hypothetical protein
MEKWHINCVWQRMPKFILWHMLNKTSAIISYSAPTYRLLFLNLNQSGTETYRNSYSKQGCSFWTRNKIYFVRVLQSPLFCILFKLTKWMKQSSSCEADSHSLPSFLGFYIILQSVAVFWGFPANIRTVFRLCSACYISCPSYSHVRAACLAGRLDQWKITPMSTA